MEARRRAASKRKKMRLTGKSKSTETDDDEEDEGELSNASNDIQITISTQFSRDFPVRFEKAFR